LRLVVIVVSLWLAAVSRCDEPKPPAPQPEPRPGDFVKLRGTLSEDVDCRLLRADNGRTYSLSSRLRGYPNGSKICIHGTVAEATSCMTSPMIEVQSLRPLSACP
jgi:hypothetical protein